MSMPKTLEEAVVEYAAHLRRRSLSENTRKAFLGDVRIFMRYINLSPRGSSETKQAKTLGEVTSDDIRDFISDLERGNVSRSPKSVERRLTSLKVMFKWLYETGCLLRDPAETVAYKPYMDALPEFLSKNEVKAVIEAARQVSGNERLEMRPLTAIMLVLDTGIKKSECLELRREFILKEQDGRSRIIVRYEQQHLKFKNRSIYLSDECAQVIDAHIQQYTTLDTLFDCTGRNLEYLFNRKVAPLAGIGALTFEMLRWTCAVTDYQADELRADQLQVKYGLSDVGWAEMEAKLVRLLHHGPENLYSSKQANT